MELMHFARGSTLIVFGSASLDLPSAVTSKNGSSCLRTASGREQFWHPVKINAKNVTALNSLMCRVLFTGLFFFFQCKGSKFSLPRASQRLIFPSKTAFSFLNRKFLQLIKWKKYFSWKFVSF